MLTSRRFVGVLAALASLALLPAQAPAAGCANEQLRTGYSANLPDCRAYELVSSPGIEPFFETSGTPGNLTEGGQRLAGGAWGVAAAADGNRLGFFSTYAPAGSTSDGPYYLASRGADGWSTANVIPPQSVSNTGRTCFNAYMVAYSPDLSKGILADGDGQREGSNCGSDEPLLAAGEPLGVQNLFLSDLQAGTHQLIDITPAGAAAADAWFQAASADLSRVVFDEQAKLTADAPAGDDLYIWSEGRVHLVTILPDGTPAQGSLANADLPASVGVGPGAEVFTHAVSAAGSRVFFVVGEDLYVRENPERAQSPLDGEGRCTDPAKACTVQVDASRTGGLGGGGTFKWASSDGSRVFFSADASRGLTADTVPGSGQNLYEYDLGSGTLSDITPAGDARVEGVSGVSEDGAYVYLVAEGVLAAGATSGQPNLYVVRDGGAPRFIVTLDASSDALDWDPIYLTSRVSPSGVFIAFNSTTSPTGYDNTDAISGERDQEIFLYEAAGGRLSCASCDPSGAPPTAPARIHQPAYDPLFELTPSRPQRNLTDSGQVFFDTSNAVLPRDGNGQSDVYEYAGHTDHLISSGTGAAPSYFYETSASGNDVFFFTSQQLVPLDGDAGISVYDARVGGGFPEPASPPECDGEGCRGATVATSGVSAPGSATFAGAGNLVAAAPVHVTPKRVVKKHAKKRKTKKKKKGNGRKSAMSRKSSWGSRR